MASDGDKKSHAGGDNGNESEPLDEITTEYLPRVRQQKGVSTSSTGVRPRTGTHVLHVEHHPAVSVDLGSAIWEASGVMRSASAENGMAVVPVNPGTASSLAIQSGMPLLLALLPAIVTIVTSETTGLLVTDMILIGAIGWVLYGISEGTWYFYINSCRYSSEYVRASSVSSETGDDSDILDTSFSSSSRHSNAKKHNGDIKLGTPMGQALPVISLIMYLFTPFIGGAILHFARDSVSRGSHLINNFNIFLFMVLELMRIINKLGSVPVTLAGLDQVSTKPDKSEESDDASTIHRQHEIVEVSEVMNKLQAQLNGLREDVQYISKQVDNNETVLQSELYAVWKGMDQVSSKVKAASLGKSKKITTTSPVQEKETLAIPNNTEDKPRTVSRAGGALHFFTNMALWLPFRATRYLIVRLPFRVYYKIQSEFTTRSKRVH